jgi:hypothetical protein
LVRARIHVPVAGPPGSPAIAGVQQAGTPEEADPEPDPEAAALPAEPDEEADDPEELELDDAGCGTVCHIFSGPWSSGRDTNRVEKPSCPLYELPYLISR